ncbi:serine hydrolase [Limnochorda pilosa]|uniref:Beta-lactamase n=1 Tax=Limnochorda pilosa TaxID=1555112 RepID=A0A0K2SP07_LIMPI|nr:serine hydrolase [Limnochorda pilosa]BAS28850.1 beta-lactamase [Limnochorda pilosa]
MMRSIYDELTELDAGFSGTLAVAARGLSGRPARRPALSFRAAETFPAASVIKLPILVEAFRQAEEGRLDLARRVPLRTEDQVGGSGVLKELEPGLEPTLRDLLTLMIVVSDNTATNMVMERVGIEAVNASAQAWGLRQTYLAGPLLAPPERQTPAQREGRRSTVSPADMVELLTALHRHQILSEAGCEQVLEILGRQHFSVLGRELGYDLDAVEDGTSDLRIQSKSGSIAGVRNDVGIISTSHGAYAVAVMTKDSRDRGFAYQNEGETVVARASRLVFDHWLGPGEEG